MCLAEPLKRPLKLKSKINAMNNRKPIIITLLLLLIGAIAAGYFYSNRLPSNGVSGKTSIKIGIQTSPAMALVMTAKEEGAFEREGLDVELVPFTAGKFALQALLGGSLDYCVSGEVPIALATLQGNKLTVLSQVVRETTNEVRVVARKDESAALGPAAYFKAKKRKLATSMGGGPEFFTHEFLKMHGIALSEVELIAQKPEDMPAALASGSVDAIAVFDPFSFIAEQRLGAEGVTFADTTGTLYSEYYVLSVGEKQIEASKKTAPAVLRALVKAGEIIQKEPAKAKAAVEKHTKLDPATISGIWPNFQFDAALTPKLLTVWQAQAQWAKATDKVPAETAIPDFRSIVADETLRTIKPEAVTIPAK